MKLLSKIAVFLLTFILVTTIVPSFAIAVNEVEEAPAFTDYYGRDALEELPNSNALIYAYDQLAIGVGMSKSEITVYNGSDSITFEEFQTVLDAYIRDYAHHFWRGTRYYYSSYPHTVVSYSPQYIMTGDALEKAKADFEIAVNGILANVNSSMSDYEKELIIHDKLVTQMEYVSGTLNSHDSYGALVNGQAVCEGYAEAFQYLLHRVGIQSFLVLGTGNGGGHEWNAVRIDGKYYHVDPTWNDQGDIIYHAYFNMSDDMIKEDHTIDSTDYAMPKCDLIDAHYFQVSGITVDPDNCSVSEVAKVFNKSTKEAHVFVDGDLNAFFKWSVNNIRNIAVELGVVGSFSCSYSYLGREVVLIIDGYIPEPEPEPEYILGDVNDDGDVTNADVLEIYKYIYNPALYPIDVKAGDVNGDGDVTNADVLEIYKYIYNPNLYPIG